MVRLWRVRVGETPIMFLGPFAVEAGRAQRGLRRACWCKRACDAAEAAGETPVVLVGDEAYFCRVGFSAALAREVVLPGPVDQNRVLAISFSSSGGALTGRVERL